MWHRMDGKGELDADETDKKVELRTGRARGGRRVLLVVIVRGFGTGGLGGMRGPST